MIPAAILSATTLLSTADSLDGVFSPPPADPAGGTDYGARTPWLLHGDAGSPSGAQPGAAAFAPSAAVSDVRPDPKVATLAASANDAGVVDVPGAPDDKSRAILIAVVAVIVLVWMWRRHA